MKYTSAQEAAITAKDPFIIVSAAAGSGKTFVLTERIVARLCDKENPFDLSRLLVVTYTKAAAAEMRSRIAKAISERLASSDRDEPALRLQLSKLNTAHIQTVHSFCADFLRKNFDKCALPSDFSICDDLTRAEMLDKCAEALLEEAYALSPDGFSSLLLAVCDERSDKKLSQTIKTIYEKVRAHADPAAWIEKQKNEAFSAPDDTEWGRFLLSRVGSLIADAKESHERAKSYMNDAIAEKNRQLTQAQGELLSALTPPDDIKSALALKAALDSYSKIGIKPVSKNPDYPFFKAARDSCESSIEELSLYVSLFSAKDDPLNENCGAALSCLCGLLLRFDELYSAEKRRRRTVDYQDLEHFTLRLLEENPDIAKELRQNLQELLVDEYQDTNEVQDRIFSLIAPENGSSFFVGDLKQSIYGFRLADPSIFLKRYKESSPDGKDGKKRIDMSTNFRSRPEVLELCNHIFERTMSEGLGGIDYDESQRLFPKRGRDGKALPSELCLIDSSGIKDIDDDGTAYEAEAIYAAKRIKELLKTEEVPEKKGDAITYRPASPDDFAILLSSFKSNSRTFKKALEREHIPCSVDIDADFTTTLEGTVIYSLLKIIDNPRQEIPLLSVLYSPLFSFTPDELALIRTENGDGELWDALSAAARNNEKCRLFIEKLHGFQRASRVMTASRLIKHIYSETGAYGVFSAFPAAEERIKTLDAFYDLALSRENGVFLSCGELAHILDLSASSENKPKKPSGAGVRIMTIHKSKGLEYPFVFVCLLAKGFNKRDVQSDPVLVDKDLGFALKSVDKVKRIKRPSGKAVAVKEKMDLSLKSEEMRKIYVAFTRAKERLFLVMSSKYFINPTSNSSLSLKEIYEIKKRSSGGARLLSENNAAAWILYSLFDHPDAGPLLSYTSAAGKHDNIPRGDLVCRVVDGASLFDEKTPVSCISKEDAPDLSPYARFIQTAYKEYPFKEVSLLSSKITPTSLSEHTALSPYIYEPSKEGDSLSLGTAFHRFLELCDFDKCKDLSGVRLEKERISSLYSQVSGVDERLILGFFESPIGKRALASKERLREYTFSVLLPPSDLNYGDFPGEKILVNGSVDLAFFGDDGITIVDFKTDSVKPGFEKEAALKHRVQLEIYGKALSEIFETPVAQKTVFFLKTGTGADI